MNKRVVNQKQAEAIAADTQDAYSFDAFGAASWRASCRMLARRGYSAYAIKTIMRSKWTRWARDMRGTYAGNSAMLAEWLDSAYGVTPENWRSHMHM